MRKEMKEEEKVRNEHIRRGNRDSVPVKKTGPKMVDNSSDTTELATKNPAAFAKLIIDKLNKYLESLNAHKTNIFLMPLTFYKGHQKLCQCRLTCNQKMVHR